MDVLSVISKEKNRNSSHTTNRWQKNIDFAGLLSTPTATVTTAKCLFNSVISTPGTKCLIADVKFFYINNDLPEPEYMKLNIKIIPKEIID